MILRSTPQSMNVDQKKSKLGEFILKRDVFRPLARSLILAKLGKALLHFRQTDPSQAGTERRSKFQTDHRPPHH